MADFEVRGGSQATRIGRAFEQAALEDLRRSLQAGLDDATKPMREAARESALKRLPKRNGLNALVAAAHMDTFAIGGAAAAVRIVASGMDQLDLIDSKGVVVHPTYGRGRRVLQPIPAAEGWFTDAMEDSAPVVRKELTEAIDEVARRIEAAAGG